MNTKNTKSNQVKVRVTDGMLTELNQVSKKNSVSVSKVIREAINEFIYK